MGTRRGRRLGPYVLPQIEQDGIAKQYRYDGPYAAPIAAAPNDALIKLKLKAMICPSAPRGDDTYSDTFSMLTWTAAAADYAPLDEIPALDFGLPPSANAFVGSLRPDISGGSSHFLQQFGLTANPGSPSLTVIGNQDVTSNSILLIERAGRPARWRNGKPVPGTSSLDGGGWGDVFSHTVLDRSAGQPVNGSNDRVGGAYAFHAGGANHAMADGSVRFVKDSISFTRYARLASVQDGEAISTDD